MKQILFLVALCGLLSWTMLTRIDDSPYGYDEGDYMSAARLGVWANLFDDPGLPLGDFIGHGLSTIRGTGPKVNLSEIIRTSGDTTFYRHTNGPVYFIWLKLLHSIAGDQEAVVRSLNRLLTLLNLLVIYFGCKYALGSDEGQFAAWVAAILFATSYTTIVLTELCPHPLYITFYLAFLFTLTRAIRLGQRRDWWIAIALSALASATFMLGFITALALIPAAWFNRRVLGLTLSRVLKDAGLFLAVYVLAWPASLLKLSVVKSYSLLAYLTIFKKNVWGDFTLGQAWSKRLIESPLDWILLLVALLALIRLPSRQRELSHWLAFIFLTLAVVGRIPAYGPRYVTPLVPAMFGLIGLVAGPWLAALPTKRSLLYLALLALCCLGLLIRLPMQYPFRPDPAPKQQLNALRALVHEPGSRLLVPKLAVPTLHYYFPQAVLTGYETPSVMEAMLAGKQFDVIMNTDGSVRQLK